MRSIDNSTGMEGASRRHKISRNGWILCALGATLIVAIIVSFMIGRYPIAPGELFGILASKVADVQPFWTPRMEAILFSLRLPRVLMACMVGCCLSAAGASYQGIFQNPMAAPDILGASTGAAFGAALAILLHGNSWRITLNAFLFSIGAVALVYFLSQRAKGNRILSLVLAGIMIGSLFEAGTSFIKLVADPMEQLPSITFWMMGSLSGVTMSDVGYVAIPMVVGLLPIFLMRWSINVLTMGDEEAATMGVQAKRVRLIIIGCSTLITAACVSVSGLIGWVGLVIPHLARKLVGNNYKVLIPASMLIGAIFLLVVDDISRNLLTTEIPIGILTAVIGAPFFIYLLMGKGERA